MKVTARKGLKVSLEDDARRYITDGAQTEVPDSSAYYLRRLREGDLVPAPHTESEPEPEPFSEAQALSDKTPGPSRPTRKADATHGAAAPDAVIHSVNKRTDG